MKNKILIVTMLFLISCFPLFVNADQELLMDKEKQELLALNKNILSQIKNKDAFHDKKIFVKVKRSREDGHFIYKIKDVSTDADTDLIFKDSNTDMIVEGNLIKRNDDEYKFDIEHVIPPDK